MLQNLIEGFSFLHWVLNSSFIAASCCLLLGHSLLPFHYYHIEFNMRMQLCYSFQILKYFGHYIFSKAIAAP